VHIIQGNKNINLHTKDYETVQNLEHKNDDHTQYPFFQLQNLCIFNYTSKE